VRTKAQSFLALLTARFPHVQWSAHALGTLLDLIASVTHSIEHDGTEELPQLTPTAHVVVGFDLTGFSCCHRKQLSTCGLLAIDVG